MSSEGKTVSVIIPALNEEKRLEATVEVVRAAADRFFDGFEIIIVDDGSTDGTGALADRLAGEDGRISVVHHDAPRCLGGAFKSGLAGARMEFVTHVNGKNDMPQGELEKIFARAGEADIVVPYQANTGERHWTRRVPARVFPGLVNLLFGLRLRYYNHSVLYRREEVAAVRIRTDSYAFGAEALVKMIKAGGRSYVEVDNYDRFDEGVRTKAFSPANLWGVARFFLLTLLDVRRPGGRREPASGGPAVGVGGSGA